MDAQLREHLNNKAQKYLKQIIAEYGNLPIKNENGEIISYASQLLSTDIIVVETNDTHLQEQYKREGVELDTPLAHGGRTFEDDKIHFYPFILKKATTFEQIAYECESELIHELFHYFIRPQRINEEKNFELKGINSFVTEGLVDMYTRDFLQRHNLFPNRNSNYGRNVLFVKDLLNNGSINGQMRDKIAFNASIDDLLKISPYAKEFYTKYFQEDHNREKEKISVKTPFEIYTYQMIDSNIQEEDKEKQANIYRNMINASANCQTTTSAKEYVEQASKKYLQSKSQNISKPKVKVKTMPQNTNDGFISIVGILIITTLICCAALFITVILLK